MCSSDLGEFSIALSKAGKITVTFVGYGSQTVDVTGSNVTPLIYLVRDQSTQLSDVVVTGLGVRRETKQLGYAVQEVKGGAVMPHVIKLWRLPFGGVRNNPLHASACITQPRAGQFQSLRRKVEHGNVPEAFRQKRINEPRRAAADIDKRRAWRRTDKRENFQRRRGRLLVPAHLRLALAAIDGFPMAFAIRPGHYGPALKKSSSPGKPWRASRENQKVYFFTYFVTPRRLASAV